MKRIVTLLIIVAFMFSASNAYAFKGASSDWGSSKKQSSPVVRDTRKVDLKALYEEFNKYWTVKDEDDLQDRFEAFLKTKNIKPDKIDDYEDFIEVWVENFDDDPDFDDLEPYVWDSNHSSRQDRDDLDLEDIDEYDILTDEDIDELYDDFLNDSIDEEDYEEYGEYFDEVYYD